MATNRHRYDISVRNSIEAIIQNPRQTGKHEKGSRGLAEKTTECTCEEQEMPSTKWGSVNT